MTHTKTFKKLFLTAFIFCTVFVVFLFSANFASAFDVGDTVQVTIPACDTSMVSGEYKYTGEAYGGGIYFPFYSDSNPTSILFYYPGGSAWYLGVASTSNNWSFSSSTSDNPYSSSGYQPLSSSGCGDSVDKAQVSEVVFASPLSISKSSISLHEGASDAYSVFLRSAPTDDVTVTFSVSDETDTGVTLSTKSLTFTSVNWSTPQEVTVTANTNSTYESKRVVTVLGTASSNDTAFNNLTTNDITVTVRNVSNWIGTGGFWSTASNWSPATVPGTDDAVVITGDPANAPTVDLDAFKVVPYSINSGSTGIIFTSTYGNSFNGTVQGNATFKQNSFNDGTISGTATFDDTAFNDYLGNLHNAIFNDNSFNYDSTISGDTTFNNNSYNFYGSVSGNATFNNNSFNKLGNMGGLVTYNDNSYDTGSSYTITDANPTINNSHSFTFTNADNNGEWDDLNNWAGGVMPGVNDDVYITGGGNLTSDSNVINVRSAFFYGAPSDYSSSGICLDSSVTLTTTNGAVFSNGSCNNGTINGPAVFDNSSFNEGTIVGNAVFSFSSFNDSSIDGNTNFSLSSSNYGSLTGNSIFIFQSYNSGVVTGNTYFSYYSYNYGEIKNLDTDLISNTYFSNSSLNEWALIDGNAIFTDDSSYNEGTVLLDATFVGDVSDNYGTISPGHQIRKYISDTVTYRDFKSNGPWTVIADGATINVTNAQKDCATTFQQVNGGSFIGLPSCSGILINSPTPEETVSTWSPSVSWSKISYGLISCQYSYGDISHWNGVDDWNDGSPEKGAWYGADCSGNGSDLIAPTIHGVVSLVVRGFRAGGLFATSSHVTFNNVPSRVLYFYNSGSDPNWSTGGNWYSNSSHTASSDSIPSSIDQVVVVSGSVKPEVNLDTWIQPASIYAQSGIIFTSASSTSTTVRIVGNPIYNGTAKNGGTIIGNATFNDTSINSVTGRVNSNAVFNSGASNQGTVMFNGIFYGEDSSNVGTVNGTKTRYYNTTATPQKNFTAGWTVVADGVAVDVTGSTYNETTTFKTLHDGYFIGNPDIVYWHSSESDSPWTDKAHWFSDDTMSTPLGRLPLHTEAVVTLGTHAPVVDLDNQDWIAPSGIDASKTGITFTSSLNTHMTTSITGSVTFNGGVQNDSNISGNVSFNDTTKNNSVSVITGDVTFNDYSYTDGGTILGNATFKDHSYNSGNPNISGDISFYDSSHNEAAISNDLVFYGDSSQNNATTTGSLTRRYTADSTTTLDFVTHGPWTLVADRAVVTLGDTSVFDTTTTFTKLNGGDFIGEGLPGLTTCSKPIIFPGTYTLSGDVSNKCDIRADGVTINGGGHTIIGSTPREFPDNNDPNGWIDMSDNVLLYHFNDISSGTLIHDSSSNKIDGTSNKTNYITDGRLGAGAMNLTNNTRIDIDPAKVATLPSSYSNGVQNPINMTMTAWVKMHSIQTSDLPGIFAYGTEGYNHMWGMAIKDNGFYFLGYINDIFMPWSYDIDKWYNIALVTTAEDNNTRTKVQWFANGVQVGQDQYLANGASQVVPTFASFGIQRPGNPVYSDLTLDEFSLWKRALSPSEIQTIYDSQKSTIGIDGEKHSFNLINVNCPGSIFSNGANINVSDSTVGDINVSGTSAAGDAPPGGTIILVNSHSTGALVANGGSSIDYGSGGTAGHIILDADSTAISQSANNGSDGPNKGRGQVPVAITPIVLGCTNPGASNYDPSATVDNGSCRYTIIAIRGCTNPGATNYNPNAFVDDGSCHYVITIRGCTDHLATNYNPSATVDNGSCRYAIPGCMDHNALNYNSSATVSNGSCVYAPITTPFAAGGGSFLPVVNTLNNLNLKPLPQFNLNVNNSPGTTYFGNLLKGLKPLDQLKFTQFKFSFIPNVSGFLFAPLPKPIITALAKYDDLSDVLASVGLSKEQDLASLVNQNVKLSNTGNNVPGLFIVKDQDKLLDLFVTYDIKHKLVELVNTKPGIVLNISLKPLSTRDKIKGVFDAKTVDFFLSKDKIANVVISVPTVPGKYFLTTKSAPLPLVVNVVAPPVQPRVESKGVWGWIKGWFR